MFQIQNIFVLAIFSTSFGIFGLSKNVPDLVQVQTCLALESWLKLRPLQSNTTISTLLVSLAVTLINLPFWMSPGKKLCQEVKFWREWDLIRGYYILHRGNWVETWEGYWRAELTNPAPPKSSVLTQLQPGIVINGSRIELKVLMSTTFPILAIACSTFSFRHHICREYVQYQASFHISGPLISEKSEIRNEAIGRIGGWSREHRNEGAAKRKRSNTLPMVFGREYLVERTVGEAGRKVGSRRGGGGGGGGGGGVGGGDAAPQQNSLRAWKMSQIHEEGVPGVWWAAGQRAGQKRSIDRERSSNERPQRGGGQRVHPSNKWMCQSSKQVQQAGAERERRAVHNGAAGAASGADGVTSGWGGRRGAAGGRRGAALQQLTEGRRQQYKRRDRGGLGSLWTGSSTRGTLGQPMYRIQLCYLQYCARNAPDATAKTRVMKRIQGGICGEGADRSRNNTMERESVSRSTRGKGKPARPPILTTTLKTVLHENCPNPNYQHEPVYRLKHGPRTPQYRKHPKTGRAGQRMLCSPARCNAVASRKALSAVLCLNKVTVQDISRRSSDQSLLIYHICCMHCGRSIRVGRAAQQKGRTSDTLKPHIRLRPLHRRRTSHIRLATKTDSATTRQSPGGEDPNESSHAAVSFNEMCFIHSKRAFQNFAITVPQVEFTTKYTIQRAGALYVGNILLAEWACPVAPASRQKCIVNTEAGTCKDEMYLQ
ncbi:hypothetical protein B0H14DRAFT_2649396 [Mycena olivaceomarginata]|nr:hypothetical protein B0H14DRAFT_2649396 [Mycena olivaceomarginata]